MRGLLRNLTASLLLVSAATAHSAPLVAGLLEGLPQIIAPGADRGHGSKNRPKVSPAQAAQKARQQYGGKVLSVDLLGDGQYRIKIIDNGNVRVVRVPAD